MNKLFLLFFFIFPMNLVSQVIIDVKTRQQPELGFNIASRDTTILFGSSITLGNDIIVFGGTDDYSYHWSPSNSLNNAVIKNPVANPIDTTTYQLTVSDSHGCSFSVEYTVNVKKAVVGLAELESEQSIQNVILYPNPNKGYFKIDFEGFADEEIELGIYELNGKAVFQKSAYIISELFTESFALDLVPGIYILGVLTKKEKFQRQFIIH